jgi:chromosome partitioning protein
MYLSRQMSQMKIVDRIINHYVLFQIRCFLLYFILKTTKTGETVEKTYWTSTDIRKLFRLKDRISPQTLLNAEEKGIIPKANRVSRGKVEVRQWHIEQIPYIGAEFGFLSPPKSQIRICVYAPKGGVLKTTFGFNLARVFALNGIKTLVIGLDPIQASITNYTLPRKSVESLDELKDETVGLYHYLFEKHAIESVIQQTSLPTLDVIAETPELSHLELKLKMATRREYFFREKLIPALKDYQVILFDNNPGWSQLVENSLTAANVVITPMGCDIESYKAIDKNLSILFSFHEEAKIGWNHFFQIPTLIEKNNLSQQIYAAYVNNYSSSLIPFPIRRSIKGQEARAFNQCALEHEPNSELSQDYYDAITEIWSRINRDADRNGH